MLGKVHFYDGGPTRYCRKESQQRIDSALKNNGYKLPIKGVTVNLAPADIKKEGASYDLTIAIGLLAAFELIDAEK